MDNPTPTKTLVRMDKQEIHMKPKTHHMAVVVTHIRKDNMIARDMVSVTQETIHVPALT